jgi:hypothetical protein
LVSVQCQCHHIPALTGLDLFPWLRFRDQTYPKRQNQGDYHRSRCHQPKNPEAGCRHGKYRLIQKICVGPTRVIYYFPFVR